MKILRIFLILLTTSTIAAAHGRRDIPYTLIEHQMPLAGNSSALLSVDVSVHKATKMYDASHKKTALFSGLGSAIESLDPRITPNLPGTKPATVEFLTDFRNTGTCEATISGESLYNRVTAQVIKGFEGGLYARIETPFVEHRLRCTDIVFTGSNNTDKTRFEGKLDAMLAEYGLQPLKTEGKEVGLGDIQLFLGWHGFDNYNDEEITGIRVRVEGGLIIPTAREQEHEKVFAPSLGYDRHIGATGRLEAALIAWNLLEVGAQMNTTVFLKHRTERRVAVSTAQKGFIYLHKTSVEEDLGSLWGVSGHLKLKPTSGGFFVATHYSYSAQSNTSLLILNPNDPVIKGDTSPTPLTFSNAIANQAPHLSGWHHHGLTLSAGYEPAEDHESKICGHARAFVQVPLSGTLSFETFGIGGGVGVEFGMSF